MPRPHSRQSSPSFLEQLEPRRVLALVTWDGGGSNNLWSNPLNWSGDALPRAVDDVEIDVPNQKTVIADAGPLRVKTLYLNETLIINRGVTLNVNNQFDLARNAELRINGLLNWVAGTWNADTAARVNPGGRLNIGSSQNPDLGGVSLDSPVINNGMLAWQGGTIVASEGGTITNSVGKRFDIASQAEARPNGASVGLINNLGTIRRGGTSNSLTTIDLDLINAPGALISVLRGSLLLGYALDDDHRDMTNEGSAFLKAGAVLEVHNHMTHDGAAFTGQGVVAFYDGIQTLTGTVNFATPDNTLRGESSLRVEDNHTAILRGFLVSQQQPLHIDGTLEIRANLLLSGSSSTALPVTGEGEIIVAPNINFSHANTSLGVNTTIQVGGRMGYIDAGSGNNSFLSALITNLGTLDIEMGNLIAEEGGAIHNSARLAKISAGNAALRAPLTQSTSSATIHVAAGVLSIESTAFTNPGTIDIDNATLTLELAGQTLTSTGLITLQHNSIFNVEGDLTTSGSFAVRVSAATSSAVNITGQLTISAGSLAATFQGPGLAAGQVYTIFTFDSRSGSFSSLVPTGLSAPLTASLHHNPATIRIRIN